MSLSTLTPPAGAFGDPDDFAAWQVELDTLPPMDLDTTAPRRTRELTDQEVIDRELGYSRHRREDREV
ncbi:hypothetical protein [Actinoplanes sp. NPDC051494]|uniref:hypothetical protein n=1 Tax=Actinoplanes sp. NPDC051494 TaxID=3363907 RepID=UPI0037AC67D8